MTTMSANGTAQRKQLSSQLDRLDNILDGLADALNESVASAVKGVIAEVVSEAVETAVKEVLSSPELLRVALEKHTPPAAIPVPPLPPKQPTLKEKLTSACKTTCEKVKQAATEAKSKLRDVATMTCTVGKLAGKIVAAAPSILRATARKVWAYRKPCAIAVGVSVVCGTACYLSGRTFSSVANGLSAAAATLSAMTLPLQRLFGGKSG